MELKFFKKRGYDGTIRKVWTADKEVCFGLVGTVEDLLKEKVIEWCDYNDDIWIFIPYLGILQEANFGKTREERDSQFYLCRKLVYRCQEVFQQKRLRSKAYGRPECSTNISHH